MQCTRNGLVALKFKVTQTPCTSTCCDFALLTSAMVWTSTSVHTTALARCTLRPQHAASPNNCPLEQLTLRYFTCRGRGQALRFMLADSGVEWTNVIVPLFSEGPTWTQTVKVVRGL